MRAAIARNGTVRFLCDDARGVYDFPEGIQEATQPRVGYEFAMSKRTLAVWPRLVACRRISAKSDAIDQTGIVSMHQWDGSRGSLPRFATGLRPRIISRFGPSRSAGMPCMPPDYYSKKPCRWSQPGLVETRPQTAGEEARAHAAGWAGVGRSATGGNRAAPADGCWLLKCRILALMSGGLATHNPSIAANASLPHVAAISCTRRSALTTSPTEGKGVHWGIRSRTYACNRTPSSGSCWP